MDKLGGANNNPAIRGKQMKRRNRPFSKREEELEERPRAAKL
jgi:hypothetical protein